MVARRQSRLRGHILKLPVTQIAEEQHAIVEGDGKIVQPVAIEVAHRAGNRMAGNA